MRCKDERRRRAGYMYDIKFPFTSLPGPHTSAPGDHWIMSGVRRPSSGVEQETEGPLLGGGGTQPFGRPRAWCDVSSGAMLALLFRGYGGRHV